MKLRTAHRNSKRITRVRLYARERIRLLALMEGRGQKARKQLRTLHEAYIVRDSTDLVDYRIHLDEAGAEILRQHLDCPCRSSH